MKSPLPQHVAAVLFDMDDTLVDSEQAWFSATEELWATAGTPLILDDATTSKLRGGTLSDIVAMFLAHHPNADSDAVERRTRELLQRHLAGEVRPMPGAAELVCRLAMQVPIAISSNSPSAIVTATMAALGWQDHFVAMLGTEDVERPKPAPDLYLAAAARCGATPGDCVVFEDSRTGATAAHQAGAFVVAVGPFAADLGHVHVPTLEHALVRSWNPAPLQQRTDTKEL